MNPLWCCEKPEFELPLSGSVLPSGPIDLPEDFVTPNAFTDTNVSSVYVTPLHLFMHVSSITATETVSGHIRFFAPCADSVALH